MSIKEIESWAVLQDMSVTFCKHILAYLEDRRLVYYNTSVWCYGYKKINLELDSIANCVDD